MLLVSPETCAVAWNHTSWHAASVLWSWALAVYVEGQDSNAGMLATGRNFLSIRAELKMSVLIYLLQRRMRRSWSRQKGSRGESVSVAERWLVRGAGILLSFFSWLLKSNEIYEVEEQCFGNLTFWNFCFEQWKYISQCWGLQFVQLCLACVDLFYF